MGDWGDTYEKLAWFDLYSNEDHWVTYEDSCCLRISTENEKQSADIFVSTIYVKDILMWIDFYKAKGIKISSFIEKSIQHCLCDINMDDLYIELPSGKAIFI